MLGKKLRTLRDSLAMMYVGTNRKIREIKEDENAMEVIQVVMLIAVGVLAITAVWAGVNGLLEEWWTIITGQETPGRPELPTNP
ncbi:MAG: hypothetical protein LBL15_01125 [Oscillospiraceae bacterium]|jgi:hypothetical protein|nr:hypothetical protein [Oscillospiraceae bacterium]